MQEVANAKEVDLKDMLEAIRASHIDITPIIREELAKIIPSAIVDIVAGVYENMKGAI